MERTYTVEELVSALRRRWRMAAVVVGGALALAAVVIARLPSEYRARALVMVEPQRPHPDMVTPIISTTLEERVKSVRAQVYSRELMSTAVEELKLYADEREKDGIDGAVEALRTDTEVHAEGDDVFAIVVRGKDASVAARAANRLAELYIESNLQVRAGQVTRIREIVSHKLAEMRGELAKAEAKVSAYKDAHRTELPELMEARLHERATLARQIEMETGFIQEAQRRLDLQGTQPFGKDTEVGRLEAEYDDMRARLGQAVSALTPDHPDVQLLQREVQTTFARLQSARARAAENDLERRRMNEAMKRGHARIDALDARVAGLDDKMAASPMVAQQLAELGRDVEMVKTKVTQLVGKKAEVELAADLETQSAPSEFRVLESATPPALPASPNRPQLALIALLCALALGAAFAVGQELTDRSLRTEQEAGEVLALPVLASVPHLHVLPQLSKSKG